VNPSRTAGVPAPSTGRSTGSPIDQRGSERRPFRWRRSSGRPSNRIGWWSNGGSNTHPRLHRASSIVAETTRIGRRKTTKSDAGFRLPRPMWKCLSRRRSSGLQPPCDGTLLRYWRGSCKRVGQQSPRTWCHSRRGAHDTLCVRRRLAHANTFEAVSSPVPSLT
jgi:hypothetical protein